MLRLGFAVMLQEPARERGRFHREAPDESPERLQKITALLKHPSQARLPARKITYLQTALLVSLPNIPPSLLWGVWGFVPGRCCGIFRGDRQGQCDPGTELLLGTRLSSPFRQIPICIWIPFALCVLLGLDPSWISLPELWQTVNSLLSLLPAFPAR